MTKGVRHWTSKATYTNMVYQGVVPCVVKRALRGVSVRRKVRIDNSDPTQAMQRNMKFGSLYTFRQNGVRYFPHELELEIANRLMRSPKNSAVVDDGAVADLKKWPDPPHVEFANRQFDSDEGVEEFVKDYGVSPVMYTYSMSEKELEPVVELERLRKFQSVVRSAWQGNEDEIEHLWIWRPQEIAFSAGKPQVVSHDIWEYICALFLADESDGRTKICENPSCVQLKYFVQERRDQKFCSMSCRNSVGIHRWLAIQENRNQWNSNRRKTWKMKKVNGRRRK